MSSYMKSCGNCIGIYDIEGIYWLSDGDNFKYVYLKFKIIIGSMWINLDFGRD